MVRESTFLGSIGLAAAATVLALFGPAAPPTVPPAAQGSASAPAVRTADRGPARSTPPVSGYHRGEDLLEAYVGGALPPQSCTTGSNGTDCYSLDVLVATIPDPWATRMDWAYDANLESIRRAFEASGYVLDRFWLPPADARVEVRTHGETARLDSVPLREVQPGVLLFRGAENARALHLVYLVGEVSTRGVHPRALSHALQERGRLLGSGRFWIGAGDSLPLKVLGPTFSGSAPSLRRGLDRWLSASGSQKPRTMEVRVVSGSATDLGNRALLGTAYLDKGGSVPGSFAATVHSDRSLLDAFDSLVRRPMGWEPRQVALLRESGTGWGADWRKTARDQSPVDSSYLVVPFPANISGLRDEYEKNPRPTSPSPTGEQVPAERVPLTLRTELRTGESPVSTSQLTAPAADEVLDEIIKTLLRHDVRAVGIQSTDVRDRLFLAQRIRARMRDVQLVAFEGNVLYLREEYNSALRGMLVLSSYPLFLQNQWWMADGIRRETLAFPSDGAQGVFNATLVLLGKGGQMQEYTDGQKRLDGTRTGYPPIWMTAVGSRSFVPIAVLRDPRGAADYVHGAIAEPLQIVSTGAALTMRVAVAPSATKKPAEGKFVDGSSGKAAAADKAALSAGAMVAVSGLMVGHPGKAPKTDKTMKAASAFIASPHSPTFLAHGLTVGFGTMLLVLSVASLVTLGARLAEVPPGRLPTFLHRPVREWTGGNGRRIGSAVARGWAHVRRQVRGPVVERQRWHRLEATVVGGSLLFHREIYTLFRCVAVGAILLPSFVLLVRSTEIWWGLSLLSMLVVPVWLLAGAASIYLAARAVSAHLNDAVTYGRNAGLFWWMEAGGRVVTVVLGVVFTGLTWAYGFELSQLGKGEPLAFKIFLHRAVQIDSGASPLVPLMLTAAGFATWCTWHLGRLRLLSRTDAFEADLLKRGRDLWRVGRSRNRVELRATDRMACAVDDVRSRLFLLIPNRAAVVLLCFLCLLVVWLWGQFTPSLETLASVGTGPQAKVDGFDRLFRFSVLGTLVAIPWAVYRLLTVWSAQRRCMEALEETPLLAALKHLPQSVAELTRLTLVDSSRHPVDAVVEARWRQMRELYHTDAMKAALGGAASRHIVGVQRQMTGTAGWCTRTSYRAPVPTGQGSLAGGGRVPAQEMAARFRDIRGVVALLWARETQAQRAARAASREKPEEAQTAPDPTTSTDAWLTAAEDFMAVQVVDYLGWVLEQIRRLVFFLFISLLLTTALLSSYPFHPQALIKLIFLGVLLATVGALLLVLTQMNSDPVLSAVSGTDPGRVSLDRDFVLNVGLVGLVPLLTLVGSEYEGVRNILFAWVGPVLKLLSGG